MSTAQKARNAYISSPMDAEDAFTRLDESADRVFCATDRFVSHLDSVALATVDMVVGQLITVERPIILDLMAGWDSHIPGHLNPARVVGLGLNENELKKNKALSAFVIHDLNKDPHLPFPENTFDCVINTVSVDYMTRPVEVFTDVARILKPGGLFLVVFSNRMFPQKAVKVWRESNEEERTILVDEFFERSGAFEKPRHFASTGKPRPKDDKYAHMGIPSDPIYAVYADKRGGIETKQRPKVSIEFSELPDGAELEKRKRTIKDTFRCPYCREKMRKWAVPDNPFTQTWDNEFMYICFNDECPYFVRGWDHMHAGGNRGTSYRLMYNPDKDVCKPVPVPTHRALKEGIVD